MKFRNSPARSSDVAPSHSIRQGPQLVYAREGESGRDERSAAATRVLIVEDDFLVASEAEVALIEAGFEVAAVVASAEDAIAAASKQRPDIAIVDIRLAGKGDGIDAAIALFQDYGVPCIFATAHSDAYARSRAEPAQPLGWLQKPYSMPSLVRLVRDAMDKGAR